MIKIPDEIKEIMQSLLDAGYEAYIVGGYVRDMCMGLKPHDVDINSNATGDQILKVFPKGIVMGSDERQAKILTVIVNGTEVSSYRANGGRTETGPSLTDHQWTCDFYMNALAMDINGKLCGDKTIKRCGIEDIEGRKIRFVGKAKERIKEDKLRVLRAIRFIARYGLCYGLKEDFEAVQNTDLSDIPVERVRDEFMKILTYDNGVEALKFHHKIFMQILPDLYHKNMFLDGGDRHNELPFEHAIDCFKIATTITTNPLIRFGSLVHDIGKGEGRTEEDGEIHFYNHEVIGEEIVKAFMKKYKFPIKDIKYVLALIREHMFGYMQDMGDKSYVKFFKRLDDAEVNIMDYVMLIYCDRQANKAKPRTKFGDFIKSNSTKEYFLLSNYYRIKYDVNKPFSVKDLTINGHDVMKLGIEGKEIGDTLKKIYDEVMEGDIENTRPVLMRRLKQVKK